ncbi:unnamed protein product [Microthlaspi erraticum]|uniref:Uncharacterized protein n=1 Tax=Microthlaspi erraticum TaxID=1685480 RepID=A0A6D2JS78_9BRAS|nr:unnamed protein product [Microthlaspi erraticum]
MVGAGFGLELCGLGFKNGFGSTAAFGRSVGTIGRTVGFGRSERSWPDDLRSAGCGRTGWNLADGFSAGRDEPEPSAVVREKVARPRGLFPGSRGMVVRGEAWTVVAWPTAGLVSRVVMRDRPNGFELWPRLQSDGRNFGRERNIVPRPAGLRGWALILDRWLSGAVFTLLAITPFLLIQMRPFQLRWKVNSIRARRELVLMKSIE